MAKRHLYLFAYDIADIRTQNRVRRMLRAYAVGGQKSLFECWLTAGELRMLCATLPAMLAENDRLHVFRLNETVPPFFFRLCEKFGIRAVCDRLRAVLQRSQGLNQRK